MLVDAERYRLEMEMVDRVDILPKLVEGKL